MTIKYKNQVIDIGGISFQHIFDKQTKKWIKQKTDLSKASRKKVYNFIVPIIPLRDLIVMKRRMLRNVDIQDINTLSKFIH